MAEQSFHYHRAVAPMMWVLVGIAACELMIVHLLVSLLWRSWPAIILSAISIMGIGWIVAVILSMKNRPVVIGEDRLVMQVGFLKRIAVPISAIAGLRGVWSADDLKARSVLRLSLIAYPNIVVDLVEPWPGRRGVKTIAHRLDDPAAFATAFERMTSAA